MEQNYEKNKREGLSKSPEEIERMYGVLKESIRNYISRVLAENAATDDNPLECGISLEFGACGLSSLEMPCIDSMFMDDEEIIWCNTDWSDNPVELDELQIDDQMYIVRYL